MDQNLISKAEVAIRELADYEPEELFAELEIRRRTIAANPTLAGSFEVVGEYRSVVNDSIETLSLLGRKFFQRFSRDAYQLLCGEDSQSAETRQQILRSITNQTTFATLLAGAAVAHLGWSPALAAVCAMLVTKLIVKNAKDTLCEEWRKALSVT
jgi:hypothetical protein